MRIFLLERPMEPRTRILFISYIIIVLAIVAIGVVPYIVSGDFKKFKPIEAVSQQEEVIEKNVQKSSQLVGTIHVIDTNNLTKSVRFQIPTDGVFFEEQNDNLYEIMKDKKGRDIKLSYQKVSKNNEVFYNFCHSAEVR